MRLGRYLAVVVLLLTWGAPFAAGQAVRSLGNERVTVQANAVPLGVLLKDLQAVYPLDKLQLDPKVASRPVTLTLENVYPERALAEMLEAAEVDYVINGRRVVVGDWETSETGSRQAAREAGTKEAAAVVPPLEQPVADTPAPPNEEEHSAQFGTLGGAVMSALDTAPDEAPVETAQMTGDARVRYKMNGENVVYQTPGFVPYKLTPAARAARSRVDVSKIP